MLVSQTPCKMVASVSIPSFSPHIPQCWWAHLNFKDRMLRTEVGIGRSSCFLWDILSATLRSEFCALSLPLDSPQTSTQYMLTLYSLLLGLGVGTRLGGFPVQIDTRSVLRLLARLSFSRNFSSHGPESYPGTTSSHLSPLNPC